MKISSSGLFYSWVALLTVIADQITKDLVVKNIPYMGSIDIFFFFFLTHVYNTGAAFSFLADQPGWQGYLFLGIAAVVSVVIISVLAKMPAKSAVMAVSLNLVLGGAVGNAIDRVFLSHVVDFISVHVDGVFNYPAFNVADSAICVGAFLLVVISIFGKDPDIEVDKSDEKNDISC